MICVLAHACMHAQSSYTAVARCMASYISKVTKWCRPPAYKAVEVHWRLFSYNDVTSQSWLQLHCHETKFTSIAHGISEWAERPFNQLQNMPLEVTISKGLCESNHDFWVCFVVSTHTHTGRHLKQISQPAKRGRARVVILVPADVRRSQIMSLHNEDLIMI